jgi:hypothetical protein
MNKDNKEFSLLSDLAKLIREYGPEVFEKLALDMSNPEFRKHLQSILTMTAAAYRTGAQRRHPSKQDGPTSNFQLKLKNLRTTDAEKAALLIDLYDALKKKTVLPTLREMRNFALDNGLPPVKSASREKALVPFVKCFLKMPIENVREYVQLIESSTSTDDKTLEGWSKIIFGSSDRTTRK